MPSIIHRTIGEDSMAEHIRKTDWQGRRVADVAMQGRTVFKNGFDERRLYEWEIIPKEEGYILIHATPTGRLMSGVDFDNAKSIKDLTLMREAVRYSCNMNLMNLRFLAEWIKEMNSFCISFLNVPQWRDISGIFLRDLQRDFYKRLMVSEHP